ncbi:MAG: hypothetical protein AB1486_29840 [Planctomycetota bacterium]
MSPRVLSLAIRAQARELARWMISRFPLPARAPFVKGPDRTVP